MIASNSFDCAVIGAGPAGCTAAALVAEQGFRVLLLERDKLPRFHVGESLMPESYWSFKRLGILEDLKRIGFTRKNGVQFVNSNDKESQPFIFTDYDDRECAESWHVQRSEFDQLLWETAIKRGATCQDETRVTNISIKGQSPHTVHLTGPDGKPQSISARVIVDATGQQALLANNLKIKTVDPDLKKSAIWGYFEGAARNGGQTPEVTAILHTQSKDAWFWYIPLSNGTVSVGLVGDNDFILKGRGKPDETFSEEVANCPGVGRRLQGSKQVDRFYVAKEFSYSTTQHAGDGWVLVGDAYGFVDPIYSSGVFLALKSGEMAADAICGGLRRNDLSEDTLNAWTYQFDEGLQWIRKLVNAFYTKEFSFGGFMKNFPQYQNNLTDLLVGRVFEGDPGAIFDDLDPWIEELKMQKQS